VIDLRNRTQQPAGTRQTQNGRNHEIEEEGESRNAKEGGTARGRAVNHDEVSYVRKARNKGKRKVTGESPTRK